MFTIPAFAVRALSIFGQISAVNFVVSATASAVTNTVVGDVPQGKVKAATYVASHAVKAGAKGAVDLAPEAALVSVAAAINPVAGIVTACATPVIYFSRTATRWEKYVTGDEFDDNDAFDADISAKIDEVLATIRSETSIPKDDVDWESIRKMMDEVQEALNKTERDAENSGVDA